MYPPNHPFISRIPLLLLTILISSTHAITPAQPQNTTWNSTVTLTPAQITQYDLNSTWADAINLALQYEATKWATGSAQSNPFYRAPPGTADLPPGTLLSQQDVNTSTYTLAPELALSRFLYQTTDYNGTVVPASAYVLWPYSPREFANLADPASVPLVAFAHGTYGWWGNCAPSNLRDLWYQFNGAYTLALDGYAVVAPDYAGLGVDTTADGRHIPHQYIMNPAGANDVVYAVEAAKQAWPELSKEYVVVGHSQGGGVAWGVAQREAHQPTDGYLGTVAASPTVNMVAEANVQRTFQAVVPEMAQAVGSVFPGFELSEWLTERGEMSINLMKEVQGCSSVSTEVLSGGFQNVKAGWNETWYATKFNELMGNGGRDFAGPLLVLIGTEDTNRPISTTDPAVKETCEKVPDGKLEYVIFQGAGHVPTMYAAQRLWLDWVRERFEGKEVAEGCSNRTVTPLRDAKMYSQGPNWFLGYPLYAYET